MNSPSPAASPEPHGTPTEHNTSNDLGQSLAAASRFPCILALGLNTSHARKTNKKFPQVVRSGNNEWWETESRSLQRKKFGFNSLIWLEEEANLFLVRVINGVPAHFCSRHGRESLCSLILLPISFPTDSTNASSKEDGTWERCCCCLASMKFRRKPSSLSSFLARMLKEWAATGTFLFLSCSTASLAQAKSSARGWPNASRRWARASSYLPVG